MKKRYLIPFTLAGLLALAGCLEEPSLPPGGSTNKQATSKTEYRIGGCAELDCGILTNELWEALRKEFNSLCSDNARDNDVKEMYEATRLAHLGKCYMAFVTSLMGSFNGRSDSEYHEAAVDDVWQYVPSEEDVIVDSWHYIPIEDGRILYPCFSNADRDAAEQAAWNKYKEIHPELSIP